ncbi:MAG: pilus assembly protein PilP [Bdellovibrionota bacterium]
MRRLFRISFFVMTLLLIATTTRVAFAQDPTAPPPPPPPSEVPQEMPSDIGTLEGDEVSFGSLMEAFDYSPRGRRDPFVQPIPDKPVEQGPLHGPLLALQKFDLAQLRLVGIIWDVRKPQAMIKDPSGSTHLVGTNTRIGPRNGYIAVIREGEIVVVETQEQEGRLVSTAQVVKIAR